MSERDFVNEVWERQVATLHGVRLENHPQRPGLEGPFAFKGGWVLYYDPTVGSYYDHQRDLYVRRPQ